MKFNYITKSIIPALAVVLSLSSCLKDDNVQQEFDDLTSKSFVGIADASPSGNSPNSTSLGVVSDAESVPFNFTLQYIGSGSHGDIPVTVSVDEDALDELNEARGTEYVMLTPSNYTIPSTTVTIPAGSNSVTLPVSILPTTIGDPALSYALPLKITNSSGMDVSGNYSRHVLLITVKNPWDGDYLATGTIGFPPPTLGRGWEDREKTFETVNTTTVTGEAADLGGSGYIMRLTINADNTVDVKPDPASINQTIQNNGLSTYDPATRTFTLHYKYVGGTGDRVIDEVLVRQ